MTTREEARRKALADLQEYRVIMLDGHFDYGNGYHGRVYINPHALFRHPSTIWRFAQDLLEVHRPEGDEGAGQIHLDISIPLALIGANRSKLSQGSS